LAVVGAKYELSLGAVTPVQMLGNLN